MSRFKGNASTSVESEGRFAGRTDVGRERRIILNATGTHPPVLTRCLEAAAARFRTDLHTALPQTAQLLLAQLKRVPAGPDTVKTCLAVRSFPAFSMPFWLLSRSGRIDEGLLTDLCYSTLNGYYFVRLIDNVADGDGPVGLRSLLPLGGYLFDAFAAPYHRYFDNGHPFWTVFRGAWAEQAEAASLEPHLKDITAELFTSVSAHKFAAAKAPLAAALYQAGSSGELPRWSGFIDRLGAFAQLNNDLFDWRHDAKHQIRSYVQSEFGRLANPGESISTWILRSGFDWGEAQLNEMLDGLAVEATSLGPMAGRWVAARRKALSEDIAVGRSGLKLLALMEVSDRHTAVGC